jgi:hypothetical protein
MTLAAQLRVAEALANAFALAVSCLYAGVPGVQAENDMQRVLYS